MWTVVGTGAKLGARYLAHNCHFQTSYLLLRRNYLIPLFCRPAHAYQYTVWVFWYFHFDFISFLFLMVLLCIMHFYSLFGYLRWSRLFWNKICHNVTIVILIPEKTFSLFFGYPILQEWIWLLCSGLISFGILIHQ